MNDAQKKLLNRALADLALLKCKFAVIDSEGTKHGDLPVEDTSERYRFKDTGYAEIVDAMEVGDKYVFENPYPGDKVALGRYASSITSRSIATHGVGSMKTARIDDAVVATRIK